VQIFHDAGGNLRPSTHGGWLLNKANHYAYADKIGNKQVSGTWYQVFEVRTLYGDIRKVWRFFKNIEDVTGPYDLDSAPAPLLELLREVNTRKDIDGDPIPDTDREGITAVISGDSVEYLDTLRYVEGADPEGEDDEIVVAP
jgi:hypothetical protein